MKREFSEENSLLEPGRARDRSLSGLHSANSESGDAGTVRDAENNGEIHKLNLLSYSQRGLIRLPVCTLNILPDLYKINLFLFLFVMSIVQNIQ